MTNGSRNDATPSSDKPRCIVQKTLVPIVAQLCGSCLVFAVFAACFSIFRRLWGGSVIFYEALICGGVLFCVVLVAFIIGRRIRGDFPIARAGQACLLPGTLLYLLFVSLVPTIIDRSVSITVLGKLNRDGDMGATEAELSDHFDDLYVDNGKAVRVRLHEQLVSGNVRKDGDRYFITQRGSRTVRVLRVIGSCFRVNLEYLDATAASKSTANPT